MVFNIEIVGLIATAVIVFSFTLSGEKRIRTATIIGAAIMGVYGYLIGGFSVWFMNTILIFINVYKLIKLKNVIVEPKKRRILKRKVVSKS